MLDLDSPLTIDLPERSRPAPSPAHQALITGSAISPEVANGRGYQTVYEPKLLRELGFSNPQSQRVPALLTPLYGADGLAIGYQIRPDIPKLSKEGKPVKYETAYRARNMLDVHPSMQQYLEDREVTLIITEGARKADAPTSRGYLCIALSGVWNWRGRTGEHRNTAPLPDWDEIELEGRLCVLLFDSDARTNESVLQALRALASFLESRGAIVRWVLPPSAADGSKQGIDDYLAAGGDLDALFAMIAEELPEQAEVRVGDEAAVALYAEMLALMATERAYRFDPDRWWQDNFLRVLRNDVTLLDVLRLRPGARCRNIGYWVADENKQTITHGRGECNGLGCVICVEKMLREQILPGLARAFAGRDLYTSIEDIDDWKARRGVRSQITKDHKRDYFFGRLTGHLLVPGRYPGGVLVPDEEKARVIFEAVVAAPANTVDEETLIARRRFIHPATVEARRKRTTREPEPGVVRGRFKPSVDVEEMNLRTDMRVGQQKWERNGNRSVAVNVAPEKLAAYVEAVAAPEEEAVAKAQREAIERRRLRKEQACT